MFILSLLSFFNFYSFILLGIYIIKLNPREEINRIGVSVNLCFAIWNFAYVFFHMSSTASQALNWHLISSIGWISFCPFITHFFFVLTEQSKKYNKIALSLALYALPVALVIKTFVTKESPVSRGIVRSDIGWGWTYVSNVESPWFWIFLIQVTGYVVTALSVIYKWAKKNNRLKFLKQAKSIILLDVAMVILGFSTDLIIPVFCQSLPPVFNIFSIFWGIGGLVIVRNYKLMSVNEAATPELILETVMDPIIMLDRKGIICRCNQATSSLLKNKPEQMLGKPFAEYFKSQKYQKENLEKLFQKKMLKNVEVELVDGQGNIIYAVASYSVAENRLDGLIGIVVSLHNVTEYKKLTQTLENLANYDGLTNLANRRLFDQKLTKLLENYRKTGEKFAVIFMDLDGFKAINDHFGHDIGDKLLLELSTRMLSAVRKKDTLARLGGDEFVLLFNDLEDESNLDRVIDRMRENFKEPVTIEDKICKVGISFGISKCPEDGTTVEELMKKADERMYGEKLDKYSKD